MPSGRIFRLDLQRSARRYVLLETRARSRGATSPVDLPVPSAIVPSLASARARSFSPRLFTHHLPTDYSGRPQEDVLNRTRHSSQLRAASPPSIGVVSVLFSTAEILTSGIRSPEIGEVAMPRHVFSSSSPCSTAGAVRRASDRESLCAVTERLANAERELRVQFIRIAQLQAQLDVVSSALRHSANGVHV